MVTEDTQRTSSSVKKRDRIRRILRTNGNTFVSGLVGALIGASATVGGQSLASHWSDSRSTNEFVSTTKLAFYKEMSSVMTDTLGDVVPWNGPVRYDDGHHAAAEWVDVQLSSCNSVRPSRQDQLNALQNEAKIIASKDVQTIIGETSSSYKRLEDACNYLVTMRAQPDASAVPDVEHRMNDAAIALDGLLTKFLTQARSELGF